MNNLKKMNKYRPLLNKKILCHKNSILPQLIDKFNGILSGMMIDKFWKFTK